jgi:3-deoxy-D-manno-octulosonate 8-phosphate phosphatase (KDO 8-P phosphatase)
MQILSRFQLIKTFAFDMDGVLTDGNIIVDATNNWLRQMNIRDGYAIQLAAQSGFNIVVISGSTSLFVRDRLNLLGVSEVFMDVKNKADFLKKYVAEKNISMNQLLFMGDDIPDYFCMKMAGVAACPVDAVPEIKEIATYISPLGGGCGCVRDVIEKVLKLNDKWTLKNNIPST